MAGENDGGSGLAATVRWARLVEGDRASLVGPTIPAVGSWMTVVRQPSGCLTGGCQSQATDGCVGG